MATVMNSGIYRITLSHEGNEDCYYVGQSADLRARIAGHKSALRRKDHYNYAMQRAFNKYGESAFKFEIILICAPERDILTLYEQSILDFYRATYSDGRIMNVMCECVSSHLGVKRRPESVEKLRAALKGQKRTPEQIQRMREISTGKKRTPEQRAHLSRMLKGRVPHPNSLAQITIHEEKRVQKLRESLCGKPRIHSEETKRKIAASLTGVKQSPELIEKRISKLRGRKQAPEAIANQVASRRANAAAKGLSW